MAAISGTVGDLYMNRSDSEWVEDEACSQDSGNTYVIDDTAKRYWDPNKSLIVKENAVASTKAYKIQYPGGRVEFPSAPTTPVTVSIYYYPTMAQVAGFFNWSCDIVGDALDATVFGTTWRQFEKALQGFTASAERWWQNSSVSSENIGTGDSVEVTFTGYLDYSPIVSGSLSITDGVETFSDNGDGTLTGDAAGTGTITYLTGVFSVTFNSAPSGAITADYSYDITLNRMESDRKYVAQFYTDTGNSYRYEGVVEVTSDTVNTPVDALINEPITFQGTGGVYFRTE